MKLLKSAMLLIALIFGACVSASAADVPGYWREYFRGPDHAFYFDTRKTSYDPATDTATTWVRMDTPAESKWLLVKDVVSFGGATIHAPDGFAYEYTEGVSAPKRYRYSTTRNAVIPDSAGDALYNALYEFVNRDEKLADYKDGKESKARNEKTEKTAKRALGMFGIRL